MRRAGWRAGEWGREHSAMQNWMGGDAGAGGQADTGPFSSDSAYEELFPSDPAYEERDDEGAPRYLEPATEAGNEGGRFVRSPSAGHFAASWRACNFGAGRGHYEHQEDAHTMV